MEGMKRVLVVRSVHQEIGKATARELYWLLNRLRPMVKMTVSLPAALKADLERYAVIHSQLHGEQVDAAALAPHMLAWFIQNDRGFRRHRN